jgi:hypothetical protein
MTRLIIAALALTAASSLPAQQAPAAADLTYSMPIEGNWTYASTGEGSEATFSNTAGAPQLTIRCTRSTRQVAIVKPVAAASDSLWIWTSSQAKSLPATYDSATARVSAILPAFDPLLDAISASRGRIGFSTPGAAALVVPPWADVARVIEDCRV